MLTRKIACLTALLCVASFASAQVCVNCHKTVTPRRPSSRSSS